VEHSASVLADDICHLIHSLTTLLLPLQSQLVLRMSLARMAHLLRTLRRPRIVAAVQHVENSVWRPRCSARSLACCTSRPAAK
jgi:hypothetical protein